MIKKLSILSNKIVIVSLIFSYILFISPVFSMNDDFESSKSSSQTKAIIPWTPKKNLQEIIYDRELQRSWELMKAETGLWSFGRGEIILLYGTSSAGKSSVCKAIQKLYPEWSFESLDKSIDIYLVRLLQKLFPKECKLIRENFVEEDIIAIIFEGKGHFYQFTPMSIQQKASQACLFIKQQGALIDGNFNKEEVKNEMFEQAFLKSEHGRSVIIDTTGFQEFVTYKEMCLFNCPIRYILTYCPFSKLSVRIMRRNKEAELSNDTSNMRYGVHPFFQFAKLYRMTNNNCETFIERVTREVILTSFDFNFDEDLRKFPRDNPFESEIERAKGKRELLEKLGFLKSGIYSVRLTPRFSYDLILNTHEKSPLECARLMGAPHVLQ